MKTPVAIACSFLVHLAAYAQDAPDVENIAAEGAGASAEVAQAATVNVEGPAKAAFEAFAAEKYEEAVKLATPLAEKGDADAIYLLGFAHETGNGLPASLEKALDYYREAADKKHSDAIYRLAFSLMNTGDETQILEAQAVLEKQAQSEPEIAGRILGEAFLQGVYTGDPNPEKAVQWWKKASEAGDIPSMMFLARFYDGQMGFADQRNAENALKYFTMAADAGSPNAMVAVASRLLFGENAEKEEKRAQDLLKKAIEAEESSAYFVLGRYQEQVKKDLKAALAEYERGVEVKNVDCMLSAASYYLEGRGTEKNAEKGVELLEAAAEMGNAQAHFMLAAQVLQAEEPDIIRGYQHLLGASSSGHAAAQNELGLFYLSGRLGVADVSAGASWLERSAKAGFAAAQNNLAVLFERGTGVTQSYENAAQLYLLAAQQGHASATLALARFYATGAATEVNRERAWALAHVAEKRGDKDAAEFIKTLEKEMSEEQLATAKEELEKMNADQPAAE